MMVLFIAIEIRYIIEKLSLSALILLDPYQGSYQDCSIACQNRMVVYPGGIFFPYSAILWRIFLPYSAILWTNNNPLLAFHSSFKLARFNIGHPIRMSSYPFYHTFFDWSRSFTWGWAFYVFTIFHNKSFKPYHRRTFMIVNMPFSIRQILEYWIPSLFSLFYR